MRVSYLHRVGESQACRKEDKAGHSSCRGCIAGGVEDSTDNDGVAFNAVEELVGEALGQEAPESLVVEWKALGRLFQAGECRGPHFLHCWRAIDRIEVRN